MNIVYRTNTQSLFRKYSQLVTWFSNTLQGRELLELPFNEEIGLFLPNGYHKIIDKKAQIFEANFYSRAIYAQKLFPALIKVDLMQYYLRDFEETKKIFQWSLGINNRELPPRLIREFLHDIATFNPNANVETTSVDGALARVGVNESFATIRAGAGTASEDSQTSTDTVHIDSSSTSNQYGYLSRGIYLFDTSSLPDTAVIGSATFGLYVTALSSGLGGSVRLVNSNPASNTALVNSDYQGEVNNNTLQSDDAPLYSGFTINAFNNWNLNSTGLGNVNKTGISKFGIKSSYDQSNTAPTWGSSVTSNITVNQADNASNKPLLTVTYSGVSPSASVSPSSSVSPSASISQSASISPSASVSASSSASISPSASQSASVSPSSSVSPSPTVEYLYVDQVKIDFEAVYIDQFETTGNQYTEQFNSPDSHYIDQFETTGNQYTEQFNSPDSHYEEIFPETTNTYEPIYPHKNPQDDL